jgi:hypothetical protein
MLRAVNRWRERKFRYRSTGNAILREWKSQMMAEGSRSKM